MTIESKPLKDGQPLTAREQRNGHEPPPPRRSAFWDRIPVVVIGWALLAVWWAAGAKYTIDGLPLVVNVIADFFHIPLSLARIADWHWYAVLCWLPVAISFVERRNRPRRRLLGSGTMVAVVVIWCLVCGLDLGSTWLAVTTPEPTAWTLARQLATIPPLAGVWTALTTFAPEWAMAQLWRYLRG